MQTTIFRRLALPFIVSSISLAHANAEMLPDDLTELSLDALMNIEVTSVSKQAESITDAAAAIYVLTGAQIERAGARSIPEALRLVPGLHVAKVDGHSWSITARGFGGTIADKLEVLIDGRSVYTPLFSGVFWDAQDVFMPDIDRIEVIRGPAATLWGANAVNGVINIVTKAARDTQGTLAYAGGGSEHSAFAGVRHGGKLGEQGHWRAYAKSYSDDAMQRADGVAASDDLEMTQVGIRADWQTSNGDHITVQADGYQNALSNAGAGAKDDYVHGANFLTRWEHVLDDGSGVQVQFYWDHTERFSPNVFGEKRDTFDLDFRHNFAHGAHNVVWGGGYRTSRDKQASNVPTQLFVPKIRAVNSANLFVNDKFDVNDDLSLTFSTRFEYNDYTDLEVQPSVRFSQRLNDASTLWGAISRAVRIPNRLDHDLLAPLGNPNFESEELFSRELGYRRLLRKNVSIDVAIFYNSYDQLRGVEPIAPPTVTFGPIVNNYSATTRGIELTSYWHASETFDVHTGYTYFDIDMKPDAGTQDTSTESTENQSPRHQASVRWDWRPSDKTTIGGNVRHVGRIPGLVSGTTTDEVDAYTELDLRFSWKVMPEIELALSGQNLLDSAHAEWGPAKPSSDTATAANPEVERGVLAEIIWRPASKK